MTPIDETDRLRAEIERLTKERDRANERLASEQAMHAATKMHWEDRLTKDRDAEKAKAESLGGQLITALVHHKAAYNDSLAAEKSRDEALAELKKALEAIGQLRSDLQKAEEERGQWERAAGQSFVRAEANEDRAQSAEASIAKLRETALLAKDALSKAHGAIRYSEHPATVKLVADALRSLLDEPGKDQHNAS